MDGLFSENELEKMATPESILKKQVNEMFKRWYVQWYVDEDGNHLYTQSAGHICKEIRKALEDGIDPYMLEWALNILGHKQSPISAYNLQWSLSTVRRIMEREGSMTNNSTDNTYGEQF